MGVLGSARVLKLDEDMSLSCDEEVVQTLLPSNEVLHFFTALEMFVDKVGVCCMCCMMYAIFL